MKHGVGHGAGHPDHGHLAQPLDAGGVELKIGPVHEVDLDVADVGVDADRVRLEGRVDEAAVPRVESGGCWSVEQTWGTPGAPAFVTELAAEVATRCGLVCADPHADGWSTVAAVPLMVGGRTTAVLVLGRRHGPGFGTDVLAEIGGVTAVAAARLDGEQVREQLLELDRRATLERRTAQLGGALLDEVLDALGERLDRIGRRPASSPRCCSSRWSPW